VVEGVSQRKRDGLSSVLQSRYIVDALVSVTVSLAEVVTTGGGRRLSEEEGWRFSVLQSRYRVDAMVLAIVSLAEVVTARSGRRLSEEEGGWDLLCASVQVRYGI
jgi:hypothetical protein